MTPRFFPQTDLGDIFVFGGAYFEGDAGFALPFPLGQQLSTRYGRPIADIQAQWTPSTGTDNFAMLDEETASDTDYVYTTGVAVDVYKCTPMDLSGAATPAIQLRVPSGFTANGTVTLGLYNGNPLASGTLIAELSTVDPDSPSDHSYSLTTGEKAVLLAADGENLYWKLEGAY